MQRLNSPALVPTSQSSGNEVMSNALAQTSPGSMPVDPLPSPVDLGAGLPRPESSASLPVNTTASRWRDGAPGGSASWQSFGDAGDGAGGWVQL